VQHVWDHYDFTGDKDWYKSVGYPLIKGVAQFHLSTLLEDKYYNDGTLVVNPCNSPEQPPSTFGCAIDQQQISEVFMNVLKGWDASGDKDLAFKKRVEDALGKLYMGVRVGRYGQIQGRETLSYAVNDILEIHILTLT
jgi:alpha-L-fucosidase 2